MNDKQIIASYELAKEVYAEAGVDTDKAIDILGSIPISLHIWQSDDVAGFEGGGEITGGIAVTGSNPGKARNIEEVTEDLDFSFSKVAGKHRLDLHAIYGDFKGKKVDRDQVEPEHFAYWADWANSKDLGLDFNGTFFSHPLAADNFTLSSKDDKIRSFWIDHAKRSRKIGAWLGKKTGKRVVNNIWIPDGYKDIPIDRKAHREILKNSLDDILSVKYSGSELADSLEIKLFGVGVESYTVGSNEFYTPYCMTHPGTMICYDSGHFHPTEDISDKFSSVLCFMDEIMLHISRPVRWDSDHVTILDDTLRNIMEQVVRLGTDHFNIGLDYFDGSINRTGAMIMGLRDAQKALLLGLLQPVSVLKELENKGAYFERLARLTESRCRPWSAVWDYFCLSNNVPTGDAWIDDAVRYQNKVAGERH